MSRTDTVTQVATLVMSVAIIAVFLGTFMGVATDITGAGAQAEDVELYPDGQSELSYTNSITNLSVTQSLGTAAHLTGANDSELTGGSGVDPSDDTWTITTWGRLDANASNTSERRLLQLGGYLYVDYNDTQWRITYYDESTFTVHRATINAPDPYSWTQLIITRNGSALTIYRNASRVETLDLSTSGGATVPAADNWYGEVEETRGYEQPLNATQRNTTYDTPTAPVDGAGEFFRVYYDARAGEDTFDIFRTGTDLKRSNATIVDGFSGQPLSSGGLFSSADYNYEDGTLTAIDGGRLDGAPVAFVDYYVGGGGTFVGVLESLTGIGSAALTLVVLGGLAMAGRRAMNELGR